MVRTGETQKDVLVAEAARLAGRAEAEGTAVEPFIRAFYEHVAPADLVSRAASDLSDAALSIWRFAAERPAGRPKIRVLSPSVEEAWVGERSIVQIVNDDMPFLVDSASAALTGLGFDVRLIIHPVLTVKRDGAGRLLALGPDAPDESRESWMQIELAGVVERERQDAVVDRLEAVLADVRAVVGDWPAMREATAQIAQAVGTASGPVPAAEGEETGAFLNWLGEDNFFFAGYREYALRDGSLSIVPGSGRGLLRRDDYLVFDGLRALTQASPDVQAFLRAPQLTTILKSSRTSSVHRPVPMGTIIVKAFDQAGQVTGLRLLLGLFTRASYFQPVDEIPLLRQKVRRCQERSGFAPDSYNGRALQHILNTFPRDELFQIDEGQLLEIALGILHLQQRPRIALFVLRDPFERFATCLVFLPRDRYSAEVRRRMAAVLQQAFNGRATSDSTHFDQSGLARIHFVVTTTPGSVPEVSAAEIEHRLVEAGRTWVDRLSEALAGHKGPTSDILRRFASAFPTGYTEHVSAEEALRDIRLVDEVIGGTPLAVVLSGGDGAELRLKTFHLGEPVALSDVLPMLENLGLRVVNEIPFKVTPHGAAKPVWIQEFHLLTCNQMPINLQEVSSRFEEALRQLWSGVLENDGFNRLVLTAGLSAREIVVLRTYCKILRQAGSSFSQAYMEDTASAYPHLARLLVRLFQAQFDPQAGSADREGEAEGIHDDILQGLEQVESLDQDRILRGFLLLIRKTLRTNFYQQDPAGQPKPYLSVKLASQEIDLLPLPRPLFEVFVYSPRMEGCHLRGGKVARGGIRWSDRKEDFRTEVLGLMKAQMVKNAVIVPVGSKGGFVVKRPPEGGREALMNEVVACYKFLMSGLLDLTDNFQGDTIVPPPDVVRRDPDDPYLVVAADKGTATFSDIANGVALDHGFWLGDAFASGGSVGYDHKAMGITAKGAWEAVKRHFRELGADIQTTDFTCVGVGDMAGDVFGNGMLLSRHIKLIAAFNHMHIFIDPDPDPERSWNERKRLFDLPRSTWKDYDPQVLSQGGGIYERSAKSIMLSPEAQERLGLGPESLSPSQLIQALLRQNVDLLWFGGIGTYVKATQESQAEAGDRANDSLRVDAATLRAKVVGEGANLALTQRARIEYASNGGRLNTDAIDNSAGVDTSDHEVNIKIGVDDAIAAEHLATEDRASFLASMTDEVEHLVLADNYLQTLAITLAEAKAPDLLDRHVRLMRSLERRGRLDRTVEFLPDDDTIAQRGAAKRGLTRPEIAVILAYAKNVLYDELLSSDLPDAPELAAELLGYFPQRLRHLAPDALKAHRLRREIIVTSVTNELINRMGPSFIEDTQTRTGRDAGSIARAYLIVRDVFDLPSVWRDIEALDNRVQAATQTRLFGAVASIVDQAVRWFLLSGVPLSIGAQIQRFQPGIRELVTRVMDLLPESERQLNESRRAAYVADGAPAALAERIVVLNTLSTAMDIVQISDEMHKPIEEVARPYFAVGVSLGLLMLRRQARTMPAATEWQHMAVDALIDDSYVQQREIVRRVAAEGIDGSGDGLGAWLAHRTGPGSRVQGVLTDIARTTPPDLAMLTVASRMIRAVAA
jgi:glutamate dehydrogenase